jgi:16S rRNA (cytosine967-C5)-methyltransferase
MSDTLAPRQSAVRILTSVLSCGETLDSAILKDKKYKDFSDSDRHFIKLLLLTTLRRLGQIDGILKKVIKKTIRKERTNRSKHFASCRGARPIFKDT